MFYDHKIMSENKAPMLYLFMHTEDASTRLMSDIFYFIHEEFIADWAGDYLKNHNIKFSGRDVRIVCNSTIIKEIRLPRRFLAKKNIRPTNILQFPIG